MIIEELQALENRVDHWNNIKTQANLVNGYRGQLDVLKAKEDSLRPVVQSWRLLKSSGLEVDDQELRDRMGYSLNQTRQLETLFAETPESILSGEKRTSYANTYRHMDALIRDMQTHLEGVWEHYMNSIAPSINMDVINALWNIPDFRTAISEINQTYQKFEQARRNVPTTSDRFDEARNVVDQLRQSWSGLGSSEMPDEVLAFIREAGTDGAPVEKFTDTVRQWLSENGIEGSFRIRIHGP